MPLVHKISPWPQDEDGGLPREATRRPLRRKTLIENAETVTPHEKRTAKKIAGEKSLEPWRHNRVAQAWGSRNNHRWEDQRMDGARDALVKYWKIKYELVMAYENWMSLIYVPSSHSLKQDKPSGNSSIRFKFRHSFRKDGQVSYLSQMDTIECNLMFLVLLPKNCGSGRETSLLSTTPLLHTLRVFPIRCHLILSVTLTNHNCTRYVRSISRWTTPNLSPPTIDSIHPSWSDCVFVGTDGSF